MRPEMQSYDEGPWKPVQDSGSCLKTVMLPDLSLELLAAVWRMD